MNTREFKEKIYGEFAKVGKSLSSPKRLELLDLLSQSPKSVESLAKATNMSIANTSKHLQALLEAQLVTFSKERNYVYYQLASESVLKLSLALRDVAEERLAGIEETRQRFILRDNEVEAITIEKLIEKVKANTVTLIDVRPAEEYESGHIPNARSIPVTELQDHLEMLPKEKGVVAYCRGPYCAYATEAVEYLRMKGYEAWVLDAGTNEWMQLFGKESIK
ncbi:rhodanese-related sulfurtransferase/DNA-binding transcriptional ArsR family regulator [Bacillus ectoiniformans]|uniref:ArsR/SmtB family transcription factor n=1 Tax=Bacillus ectoiniformans TaxID=1494429 RepID=UPI00195A9A60|nr:metalloregulator ArsR/SmtB family transcription factor [Bacillus ectoiniformans]MBM7648200.1 rhodanese-related sulfurtransferase/DNA-binding transcriptional ArsR family regulator [Bacillus ectoiniformans]